MTHGAVLLLGLTLNQLHTCWKCICVQVLCVHNKFEVDNYNSQGAFWQQKNNLRLKWEKKCSLNQFTFKFWVNCDSTPSLQALLWLQVAACHWLIMYSLENIDPRWNWEKNVQLQSFLLLSMALSIHSTVGLLLFRATVGAIDSNFHKPWKVAFTTSVCVWIGEC